MITVIKNGKLITPSGVLKDHLLVIEDSKILGIYPKEKLPQKYYNEPVVDALGEYVSPGFIDIHVHGGGGVEASGSSPSQIVKMCAAHAGYGTTSLLPTTVTNRLENIQQTVYAIRDAAQLCHECNILGAHLEGPYFSPAQCGAQNPDFIIQPKPEQYLPLLDSWDGIKIVGAAPEIDGALELGQELRRRGILASVAHSDATFEQVEEAMIYGYSDITHIYSGCSMVHRVNAYRIAGIVEAGLCLDGLTVQVIADGKHLPASLLKLIYKCKGPSHISLITDGLCAAATQMEEGAVVHQDNGLDMIYDDRVMKMMDKQAFAGSVATMNRLVHNMITLAGVPLADAVTMATLTPAKVIGMDKCKGSLAPGKDADIIFFNEDIQVSTVMVMGRKVK